MPTAQLTRRYLRALRSADGVVRWEAAKKLTSGGGWRTRIALETIARRQPLADSRAAAVWALGFRGDPRASATLAGLLANDREELTVRCHAAEVLGHLLSFHQPEPIVEQAIAKGLDDSSPDVRFWSIFAAATISITSVTARLQSLSKDDAQVEGWWPVGTEATWALKRIAGDPHADEELPPGMTGPAR